MDETAPAEDGGVSRLRDGELRKRLTRLEHLLSLVEQTPGPVGEMAMSAVTALSQVYGEALARAGGYAAEHPDVLEAFLRDELINHLLVLHDIHPEPVDQRVGRTLDRLRTALAGRARALSLREIADGTATVELEFESSKGCCGSSAPRDQEDVRVAVREAVLSVAPEIGDVVFAAGREPAPRPEPAFVPLSSVAALAGGARA
jgi:hypothetical protein